MFGNLTNALGLDPHPSWRNAIKTALASAAIGITIRAMLELAEKARHRDDERHSLNINITHEEETLADLDLWTADGELIARALDMLAAHTMRVTSASSSPTTVNNIAGGLDFRALLTRQDEAREQTRKTLAAQTKMIEKLSGTVDIVIQNQHKLHTVVTTQSRAPGATAPAVPNDYAGNEPPLVIAPGFVSEEEASLTPEAAFSEIMATPPLPKSFDELLAERAGPDASLTADNHTAPPTPEPTPGGLHGNH